MPQTLHFWYFYADVLELVNEFQLVIFYQIIISKDYLYISVPITHFQAFIEIVLFKDLIESTCQSL